MINLILFGAPGSGKGTQANLIVNQENMTHISTGDIFRKNIQQKTELGEMARKYMDKGQLVPDKLTIDLLSSELDSYNHSKGFIFDGFPRTLPQAKAFDILLDNRNTPLSMVIFLEVQEEELIQRLLNRGQDSGREDDKNEHVIKNRISVYENQTSILKDYYCNNINVDFHTIDGEQTIENIFNEISKVISNHKSSL